MHTQNCHIKSDENFPQSEGSQCPSHSHCGTKITPHAGCGKVIDVKVGLACITVWILRKRHSVHTIVISLMSDGHSIEKNYVWPRMSWFCSAMCI
jgi:hypothetical protein